LDNCKNHASAKIGNTIQCKIYIAQEGKEEASSKGHPSNKNDDAVTSGVVPNT
jgi:hypothetical protein